MKTQNSTPPLGLRRIGLEEARKSQAPLLVLVRHGQSEWNKTQRFTGWEDVGLSEQGIAECDHAANQLKGIPFHVSYTSKLIRAQHTMRLISEKIGLNAPIIEAQELNERHYGDLQGMNKDEARAKFGDEQVLKWRRGYADRPPGGESLEDTCNRVIPFFTAPILEDVRNGKTALVVAHNNSLRAAIMYLEGVSPESIAQIELPTAAPVFYTAS